MNVDSKIFLSKKFKEYYLSNVVGAPLSVEQREFGFGTLDEKIKFRHRSFKSGKELQNYLQRETPFYISYSAAYYEFPENRSMSDKIWLGADLVFDLDAEMSFVDEKILSKVKEQAINLLEFLIDDFGLKQDNIRVNFSGSKGYHIHSWDEKILKLGGEERREMVDYVTGAGLDWKYFLHEEEVQEGIIFSKSGKKDPRVQSKMLIGPKGDSSGWAKRIYDGVWDYIKNSAKMSVDEKDKLKESLKDGFWSGIEGKRDKFFDNIIEKYSVKLTGDTDKMVTLDTTRLIRLPDSLHGGTGLRAAVVRDIDEFNPQVDAVAFGDSETKVKIIGDVGKLKLKETVYGPYKPGEIIALPEYAAVYLMLKDNAETVK